VITPPASNSGHADDMDNLDQFANLGPENVFQGGAIRTYFKTVANSNKQSGSPRRGCVPSNRSIVAEGYATSTASYRSSPAGSANRVASSYQSDQSGPIVRISQGGARISQVLSEGDIDGVADLLRKSLRRRSSCHGKVNFLASVAPPEFEDFESGRFRTSQDKSDRRRSLGSEALATLGREPQACTVLEGYSEEDRTMTSKAQHAV
jgi:hypothetical protein